MSPYKTKEEAAASHARFKERHGQATYRATATQGVYFRMYIKTGRALPGYWVMDNNTGRWVRFDTIELAREYRVSGAWKKPGRNGQLRKPYARTPKYAGSPSDSTPGQ